MIPLCLFSWKAIVICAVLYYTNGTSKGGFS